MIFATGRAVPSGTYMLQMVTETSVRASKMMPVGSVVQVSHEVPMRQEVVLANLWFSSIFKKIDIMLCYLEFCRDANDGG